MELNNTPVRTSRNFNINNIKSEDEVKQIEESNKEDKNTEEN